jgi:hypothetical protein
VAVASVHVVPPLFQPTTPAAWAVLGFTSNTQVYVSLFNTEGVPTDAAFDVVVMC